MKNPIRVLHVLGSLNRGGAETMIMNIYRSIDRSKVQFDFILHINEECDYSDEVIKLGGRIYSIPRYVGKNHFTYIKAWKTFFNSHLEYKIIHGHVRSTAAIYLKIAKKHGVLTIAHSHSTASRGNKIEQVIKAVMQLPIKYTADYLFACSEEAGKWLFGKKAISKDNYKVIKNAIDIEKYLLNETKRKDMRQALGIKDKFVVGHVGSFTAPKNHKFLINIFYELQKRVENAVLLLVGDGELKGKIEDQINKLGIKDKVILTGVVQNVNDYLQAMDVFIFPSIFEGLGIAVIEAQAAGIPCIVGDTVPREAYVTSLVHRLALAEPVEVWVNEILKLKSNDKQNDTFHAIKASGYDIQDTSKWLENFYFGGKAL